MYLRFLSCVGNLNAFLFIPYHLFLFPDVSPAKISEAFGSGKCLKLIEQCKSENIEIRQKALAILCEELRNPFSVVECFRNPNSLGLQALHCLSKNLAQNDIISRVRSAEVIQFFFALAFILGLKYLLFYCIYK